LGALQISEIDVFGLYFPIWVLVLIDDKVVGFVVRSEERMEWARAG
jgi:hypothetical protein